MQRFIIIQILDGLYYLAISLIKGIVSVRTTDRQIGWSCAFLLIFTYPFNYFLFGYGNLLFYRSMAFIFGNKLSNISKFHCMTLRSIFTNKVLYCTNLRLRNSYSRRRQHVSEDIINKYE